MVPYGLKRKCRYVWLDECGSRHEGYKMKRTERQQAKIDIRKELEETKESEGA
jgi:hypothetical protein